MMQFGKYHFHSVFEEEAILPPYKGSTFRGLFGHALRKVVCVLKTGDCAACMLNEKCLYAQVFETPAGRLGEGKPRLAVPPHPYVIEPPPDTQTRYSAGDAFDFTLFLFGRFNESLPYFIFAFEQMGQMGAGQRINGRRPRFVLEKVTANGADIYTGAARKIQGNYLPENMMLPVTPASPVNRVEINLLTPLRLKYLNELESSLSFHVLIRAALRRVSSLFAAYGDGEPELDYRGLVKRAQEITIEESHLHWFDWRRWSNRQDQEMLMGGLIGKVAYCGDLTEFIPLLLLCETLHLGKQTAFGLGKIKIST
jgi:hypothetical protein